MQPIPSPSGRTTNAETVKSLVRPVNIVFKSLSRALLNDHMIYLIGLVGIAGQELDGDAPRRVGVFS